MKICTGENLEGMTNFEERGKHPRFKYEDLIASIICSEWYILNKTECHSPGEELFHEDFYCTQKVLNEMRPDDKAYMVLQNHCQKYNFIIRPEEKEDLSDLNEI